MSRTVSLELDDELYAELEKQSIETGRSLSSILISAAQRLCVASNGQAKHAGPARDNDITQSIIWRNYGAISLTGSNSDNEQIDADLAREYGSTHEDD